MVCIVMAYIVMASIVVAREFDRALGRITPSAKQKLILTLADIVESRSDARNTPAPYQSSR